MKIYWVKEFELHDATCDCWECRQEGLRNVNSTVKVVKLDELEEKLPDREADKLGRAVAEVLQLKHEDGIFDTALGGKSHIGLGRLVCNLAFSIGVEHV